MQTEELSQYQSTFSQELTPGKRILLLDTSSLWVTAAAALVKTSDSASIWEYSSDAMRDSFRRITPAVKEVLRASGTEKPDLIITSAGPGSFTGIRVGVSLARNLSQLWHIPVYGVNSLFYYGTDLRRQPEITLPAALAIDGKQSKCYFTVIKDKSGYTGSSSRFVFDATLQEITEIMKTECPDGTVFTDIPDFFKDTDFYRRTMPLRMPSAASLLEAALLLNYTGQTGSWEQLLPVYMRDDPATAGKK